MSSRKSKRRGKIYLVMALLSLVLSTCAISTAYVAISNISISGFMSASKWDVHFDNLSSVYIEGDAKEVSSPIIDEKSTNINSFRVDFYGEGKVTYVFDVVNDGTFDAFISSITLFQPICFSSDSNEFDESSLLACKSFYYNLTYLDDTDVKVGDLLPKNSRKTLKITMWYNDRYVLSKAVTISDISASVIYSEKY